MLNNIKKEIFLYEKISNLSITVYTITSILIFKHLLLSPEYILSNRFGSIKVLDQVSYKNGMFILFKNSQQELNCSYFKKNQLRWNLIYHSNSSIPRSRFKYLTWNIINPDPIKGIPGAMYGEKLDESIVLLKVGNEQKQIDLISKNYWLFITNEIGRPNIPFPIPTITAVTSTNQYLKIYPDYSNNFMEYQQQKGDLQR